MTSKSVESITELLSQINEMTEERDWAQFHSPKNLAMNLQVESSEVAEHFTWLTEPESYQLSFQKKQEVSEELGDVFINLVQLSDKLGIDLIDAAVQKIAKIKVKYPAALSRGKALKYTTYSEDKI